MNKYSFHNWKISKINLERQNRRRSIKFDTSVQQLVALVAKSGSGTRSPQNRRKHCDSPFWREASSDGDGTWAETRQVPSPLQPVQIIQNCFNFSDSKKLSYLCLRSKRLTLARKISPGWAWTKEIFAELWAIVIRYQHVVTSYYTADTVYSGWMWQFDNLEPCVKDPVGLEFF